MAQPPGSSYFHIPKAWLVNLDLSLSSAQRQHMHVSTHTHTHRILKKCFLGAILILFYFEFWKGSKE